MFTLVLFLLYWSEVFSRVSTVTNFSVNGGKIKSKPTQVFRQLNASRLVFTNDGVVVGVVIRRVERYDLVKIKPTESEAEHRFCSCLLCLRSSENCIVGVASRSGRISQWQCSIADFAIGRFFRFCFRLRQPSFHWIMHKRRSRKRNRKKWKRSDSSDSDSVELMTASTPIFDFH